MVGTVLAALSVAAMLDVAAPVTADDGAKLADAIALSRVCPSLTIDRDAVALALARKGIRLAPMMPQIASLSRGMALRYVYFTPREACALGRKLYGTDGSSAAGFLAER